MRKKSLVSSLFFLLFILGVIVFSIVFLTSGKATGFRFILVALILGILGFVYMFIQNKKFKIIDREGNIVPARQ